MRLYLGTHLWSWIGRSPRPLFASLARAPLRKVYPVSAVDGYALDSGGFTQAHKGGWTMTPAEYLERVYSLADRIGGMRWAAPQDLMCEPSAVAATGLTVEQHMRHTVDNYCELAAIDERQLIVPVLQGWKPGDHERCADYYADAGVDLHAQALVGVGTICRRQATAEIGHIVYALAKTGLRLHGFGVKTGGLARYGQWLTSADSLAWSDRARNAHLHGEGAPGSCRHPGSCANCYPWAHEWYARVVAQPLGSERPSRQLEFEPVDTVAV